MVAVSISIDVPELAPAVGFYTNALACTKLRDQPPNSAVVAAGNLEIHLLVKEPGTNPVSNCPAKRSYERHWTPIHLDFLIEDVQGAVTKILEFGGAHEGHEKGEWGEIAYCADPFGNGFCVIRE